ncbi:MAG TPA: tetratricopeptide repeat protein [Terriglobales bacterium]
MKRLFLLLLLSTAFAQTPATPGQMVFVVRFENRSKAPGLEWISESFPELFRQRLTSPALYVIPREDRLRAYDRLAVPANARLSRATLYRIAEQLDVDYVVLGSYDFDGRNFSATAQLLDMRRERLLPAVTESGPLTQLLDTETLLAWDLLQAARPVSPVSKQAFLSSWPSVRLDAFENYIRGMIGSDGPDQIQHYREAIRLNPTYTEALLQLGKTCFRERQYSQAAAYLARVPTSAPEAREANFYLGLAAYYAGDFARSESAFAFVAARLPLSEVYNNLGVVASRRGEKTAVDYFQRALDADPDNADYHFNLAVSLYRRGDATGANQHLHESLTLRPDDSEAKTFMNSLSTPSSNPASVGVARAKPPLERIRLNYEESSFRQMTMKIQETAEQRLAKTDVRTHAQFHADRGHEFLKQGFISEAEREFREATALDSSNAEAHAGLATVLEANNDITGARSQAESALALRQLAEPLLVLARLDLRDNNLESASAHLDSALRLEPMNGQAQSLKRSVAAKLAEKAQPLPSQ